MSATMCLAFGTIDTPEVWIASMPVDWSPELGGRAELEFRDGDNEHICDDVVGQVIFIDTQDDGTPIAFVFVGEELPDEDTQDCLDAGSFIRMDEDQAREVLTIVMTAPPVSAVHDLLLIVGDPMATVEDGQSQFQLWQRVVDVADPIVPMFGERMHIKVLDCPNTGSDAEDDGNAVARPTIVGTSEHEADAEVTIAYAAQVEVGIAQIAFWVPSLGDIDGFALMASGWAKINDDDIDDDFRLSERILLAQRTTLDVRYDEDGDPFLHDFAVRDAEEVTEDQYPLLPPGLAEHCRFARELVQADDIVASWSEDNDRDPV
jgi:hypothetical protein